VTSSVGRVRTYPSSAGNHVLKSEQVTVMALLLCLRFLALLGPIPIVFLNSVSRCRCLCQRSGYLYVHYVKKCVKWLFNFPVTCSDMGVSLVN